MDIGFNIVSDSSQFLAAFAQADQATKGLAAETDALSDQSKTMFKGATKEVGSYTDAIEDGTKATGTMLKEVNKVGTSVNVVKKLKEEIRFYTSEAQKAGPGTKAWTDNLAKAGKLKDELGDLNAAVKSLNGNLGENFARAAGESLNLVKSGYEGVLGVQGLMNEKSEEFEKILVKLQSLNALSNVIREFSGIKDKIEEIRLGFSPVLDMFRSGAGNIASTYSSANETLVGFFKNFSGNAKDAFKNAVSFVGDFGKSAGSVAKNIGTGFVSFFSNFGTNMKTFATSAKNGINTIGTAIKANPLGIILTIITLVIGAFVLLKDKVKPIADLFEALGEIWDAAADAVERLGQALGIMASEAEKKAEATIKSTADEVAAIEKRYDREIKLLNAAGKETTKTELAKNKATADRVIQTLKLLEEKRQREKKLEQEELKQRKELEEQLKDIVVDSIAIQLKARVEAEKKAADELKKKQEDAKRAHEARMKLEQDFQNSLNDLLKKANTAELEGLAGKAKIERQKQLADEELQVLRATIEKKGKELDKSFKFTADQEAQFGKIQAEINRKYNNDILTDDIKLATERADIKIKALQNDKDVIDSKQKLFDTEQQIKEAQIKLLQKPVGVSEEDFELIKQKAILEIKKKAALDSLELKIKQSEDETAILLAQAQKEIDILNAKGDATSVAEAKRIQETLDGIKANGEAQKVLLQDQAAVVINETQDQINKVDKEINSKGPVIDWAKLLGISEKDLPALKSAMTNLVNNVTGALTEINNARQEALDKELDQNQQKIQSSQDLIDQRESELDDLRGQLNEELQLRNDGFANNVDLIRQEIENKKAQIESERQQKQKALEDEKKLQKEKEKIARQQAIIDSITQGSQILTAGATLFAKGAVTGPVGIITAIATIAGMVASFLALKSKLQSSGFHDGGYTGEGNEWDERGPVHADEYVMNKKITNDNWDLLHGLHTKDDDLVMNGIRNLIKGRGISLASDIAPELNKYKSSIKTTELSYMMAGNNSGMESRLENVEGRLVELVVESKKKHTVLPDGTQIIRNGSNTTTIRPKG